MRFPPAALLFTALCALLPSLEAEAVQACLSEEFSRQDKHARQESIAVKTSELCKEMDKAENAAEQPNAKDSQAAETTVLIMLLRAYAEAFGGVR